MGLRQLLAAIGSEAEAKIAAIEVAAEEEARAVLAEAAAQAEQVQEAACQGELRQLANRREQRRLRAQLTAAEIRQEAVAQLVERTLAETAGRLGEIRQRPDYDALLARWFEEARAALGASGPLRLEVDPHDEARIRALQLNDSPVTIGTSLHTQGGLRVTTPDGRIRVDNTVETRLESAASALRTRLARFYLAEEP